MKFCTKCLLYTLLLAPLSTAQKWEFGGLGAFGFTPAVPISNQIGSVSTGIKTGPVFGVTLASNDYKHLGGEGSYLYRRGDLKLGGLGTDTNFSAYTHFLDFRMVYHFAPRGAKVRPFVAAGGGVAMYAGTGRESSTQPLNNFAALTATHQTEPMISVAGGVKMQLSPRVGLRFELRDSITPFPNKVIAPYPGSTGGGWLHNFTPMVGIVTVF